MASGDVTQKWGSSAAITITLASLATDATGLLVGRESTAIDIATLVGSNPIKDLMIGGQITVGTTPTINTVIGIWVFATQNDTPLWPGPMDGTDSAETWLSIGIRDVWAKQLAMILVDATTSDRPYGFAPRGIAQYFGNALPKQIGIFVAHNTGVNLNSTGSNHVLSYTPVYDFVSP